jgi:hypothetical protein
MDAIDRALSTTESRIREMGIAAKKAVAHISPENSATHLHEAVEKIIASRNRATAGSIGSLKGQAI